MKKLLFFTFVMMLMAYCPCCAQQPAFANDFKKVKENYIAAILPHQDSGGKGNQRIFNKSQIQSFLDSQSHDGSWPDIDYANKSRSSWRPQAHTSRVLLLAKAYCSDVSPFYGSKDVLMTFHNAINFWFKAKLRSLNWWNNQIGVPMNLGPAFVLMEKNMTAEEKEQAVEVMNNAKFGMTGQNKIWLAGNVLLRAFITDDEKLAREAVRQISDEIVVGRDEGIQWDWSFHQHGSQQQFGNYGLSYINNIGFYWKVFQGTSFEFSRSQQQIMRNLINNGYRWIIWKRRMDISSCGRQLFPNTQRDKARSAAEGARLIGIDLFGKAADSITGYRHFENSDYSIFRTSNWMTSLKMQSSRTIGTELVNEDNQLGFLLGDGATYFYRTGREYDNIFPLWEWSLIPGVTGWTPQGEKSKFPRYGQSVRNKSGNVGGLGHGDVGFSAMQLQRGGMFATKSWLFCKDFVVCLGAGIHGKYVEEGTVSTCVDQRWANGKLLSIERGKKMAIGDSLVFEDANEVRLFHDSTGYIILGSPRTVAAVARRTGNWNENMGSYDSHIVSGNVMTIRIDHGTNPANANYCYVVLPATDSKRVAAFNVRKLLKVWQNTDNAQIVSVSTQKGMAWAAIYESGKYRVLDRIFYAEKPGIYLLKRGYKGLEVVESRVFSAETSK